MKKGFDNAKYLQMQSQHIRERIAQFDNKLYLEFGGKLFDDYHASRVLPGFEPDSKLQMLLQLKEQAEIVIVISAEDIVANKMRGDYGITYDVDVVRLVDVFRDFGLYVGSIALTQNTMNVTENAATESFRATWAELAGTMDLDEIKLLDTVLEGAVVDEATAINLSIIQANPDIIGAFGTTGNSPVTWASAAEKAGYADGELVIVGMDATEGNLDMLESGKVTALVAQPLYEESYKTMEYLDQVLRGNEVPMWTDLEAPVVTIDGEGQNGPAYHREIAAQVTEFFK